MLKAREEAIIQTVNRLLAEKGFEAMTVDEVALQVGIAGASAAAGAAACRAALDAGAQHLL